MLTVAGCRAASVLHQRVRALATAGSGRANPDFWPDGSPKKFCGREAWKNWIDWDSKHTELTDELNRARHYFWHVDNRGRLWRRELDRPGVRFGQMRDARILDVFFSHMQANRTGLYAAEYPYISFRMHEHYFTSCADAPVVFNDLRDGELRHICPDGELARSVTTPFAPSRLRLDLSGKLFHPVTTRAIGAEGAPCREELMALLESTTAHRVLECCAPAPDGEAAPDSVLLSWGGEQVTLRPWPVQS
jgi:hypothetical protein